jgi:4-amino-4-deoxy-L-arabinose transferase-like glycosyltransferase
MALCFFSVLICYAVIRKDTLQLRNVCLAGVTALLSVIAWTFYAGLNPVSWYRMLVRASSGDKVNVSPLMGGSWGHFSLDLLSLVLPAGLACWLILWAVRRGEKHSLGSAGALLTVVLANAALYLTLTSRALSYEIFWLVPLIPVVVAATALYGEVNDPKRPSMVYVLAATILITAVLRIGKVTEVITSWAARDPQPLKAFVCTQVPQDSRVFGPAGPYYYAVEECGSHYLYAGNWTASGLRSQLDANDPVYHPGDFLLWPADLPLPRTGSWQETARFRTQVDEAQPRSTLSKLIRREFPFTGGYPQSVLYHVK